VHVRACACRSQSAWNWARHGLWRGMGWRRAWARSGTQGGSLPWLFKLRVAGRGFPAGWRVTCVAAGAEQQAQRGDREWGDLV
jgi:hypothetical protein